MLIQSLKKLQESQSNIGPLILKDQSYNQYKKSNSELSLYSEQRDNQIEQQLEIKKEQSRRQSIMSSMTIKKNVDLQKNVSKNQLLESQQQNFFHPIKCKNVRDKFISNLLSSSYVIPQKWKSVLIDDQRQQGQSFKYTLNEKQEKIIFDIFQPGNQVLLIWDMFGILINTISLWLSPFQAAFHFESSGILYFIIICYLLLDILVNLNRSTISMGEIINTRALIIKNYFQGNAVYDIISLMIWIEISVSTNDGIWQEILQIVQLIVTIKKVLTNFDQFFESLYTKGIFTGLTDLITLIISIYFFAHVMACIWFYIGEKSGYILSATWLRKMNIENESVLVQYNYSIYWAITTIVTVGYGDITPQNWVEMTFSTVMMVLSSCVYAYSLNSIGIILKNFQDNKYHYKKMLLRLNNFMDKNKVQLELQLRARNFLKFHSFQNENYESQEEIDQILKMMPERLRNSINNDIQLQILNQITFLKGIFTTQTVGEIAKILETVYLTPDEILYQQNEFSDASLYYVFSGSVILYEENSKKILATLTSGKKFGEYQFFTGLYPKTSVKSLSSVVLYKINREKLLQIIKYKEKDFQRFNNIKDELLLNNDYTKCFASCSFCNRYSHETIDCPLFTYQPNLEQRLKKENFHVQLFPRQPYKRRNVNKINSLIKQKQVDLSVKSFLEEKNTSIAQLSDFQSNKYQIQGSGNKIPTLIERKSVYVLGDVDAQYKSFTSGNKILKQESRKKTQMRPSIIATTPGDKKALQQQQIQGKDEYSSNQIQQASSQLHSVQKLSSNYIVMEFNVTLHIDEVKEYNYYMPQHNISKVIQKIQRLKGKQLKKHLQFVLYPCKYSIFYYVKLLGYNNMKKKQSNRKMSQQE